MPQDDSRIVRIALVGVGHRARIFSSINNHSVAGDFGARIVAAADPADAARPRAAEWLGADVPVYRTLDEMLSAGTYDAAIVATPDDVHADPTVTLLRAGIPVYLEKPIATTVFDADRVLQAAADTGTTLYVGHNMRLMRVILTMKELIDSGEIGEVRAIWCRHFVGNGGDYYFKDWHAERAHTTSLLLQKAAHDIDVIHWLSGGRSTRVVAMGNLSVYNQVTDHTPLGEALQHEWIRELRWPPLAQVSINPAADVEDLSMMLMELDNGVLASYQQCHYTPDYWRNYTVIGTAGRIENIGDGDGAEIRVWNTRTPRYQPRPDRVIPIDEGAEGHVSADIRILREFLSHLRGEGDLSSTPLDARDAVAAGISATQSLRNGSIPVLVPEVPSSLSEYFSGSSH